MREKQISAAEFKAKCLGLLDDVASGASVVITKSGKPVARVIRATPRCRALMGGMVGTAKEVGDIVQFHTSTLWESSR